MKTCFLAAALVLAAVSAQAASFRGTVTAVDSNGNAPTRSFTAVDSEGHVKFFKISSLADLDKGDRVVLSYIAGDKYPLEVKTIKFLAPAK